MIGSLFSWFLWLPVRIAKRIAFLPFSALKSVLLLPLKIAKWVIIICLVLGIVWFAVAGGGVSDVVSGSEPPDDGTNDSIEREQAEASEPSVDVGVDVGYSDDGVDVDVTAFDGAADYIEHRIRKTL